MTKILINGREFDADPKKQLIEACHASGAMVPVYCYHPGLEPKGSCRICQVEIKIGEAPARVVPACRTDVVEGMVVDTESPRAHETRRECLEFLLKNHPLDCPICDKAGECDLQDYAYAEGQLQGRSTEPRRKLAKRKSLGDVIVLDQERCILCYRCVRFFEEVTGKAQLTMAGLGAHSKIETFGDRPLSGNYQGNLADICPVGALTLKNFRFQARVWNLKKFPSVCGECSRGCRTTVEVLRGGAVKRFRPRFDADVNRWWMCDVGRFALDRANPPERLGGALLRGFSGLEESTPEAALERVAEMLRSTPERELIVSPWLTVEEGERVLALARELGARAAMVSPEANEHADDLLHTGDPAPNRRGLTELGFEAVGAEDCLERLRAAPLAFLIGERVVELCGPALAELPATKRLVVFDAVPPALPAAEVCLGLPLPVERTGTWVNVDGHRGALRIARQAPSGVRPLEKTIDTLLDLMKSTGVEA